MRSVPILLAVLLAAVGIGLGLRVMLTERPASSVGTPPANGARTPAAVDASAPFGGVPQGHVYAGVAEEPNDVNPFTTHAPVARRLVLGYTHESLLESDPQTGQLRPALASAFVPSPDGTSCLFTLRQGVLFADGTPMTMADVLFGWELAKAGHLPLGFAGDAFRRVEAVEVLDEQRLRVHFRGVYFAAVKAVGESWIVAKRQFFVDRVAEQAKLANEPMPAVDSAEFAHCLNRIDEQCGPGTGPYVLHNSPDGESTWRRRQDLLLVRNEHCWRRQAQPGCWNFAGIRTLFRDPTGAFNALLNGEIDWYSSATRDALLASRPELGKAYRPLVYRYNTLGVYCMLWNCRRPPFDDVRVRRALGLLFDPDGLDAVFDGTGVVAKAFCTPGNAEYPDVACQAFDIGEARRQLREVGFDPAQGKPLRLKLLALQGNEQLRRTVELFADAAERAGIDLHVQSRDYPQFLSERSAGDWDGAFAMQTFRASGDPYDFLHSEGPDNHGRWHHPEADRLASEARTTIDEAARIELWRQLHTLVYQEQPVAFVMHPSVVLLLNVHLQNAAPGPLGLVVERAFVEPRFQRQ